MKRTLFIVIILILFSLVGPAQPLKLHPLNQRYFEYKGNPVVLVTSAEHYGAVLNRDFDYRKYLATMAAEGMNYTRIIAGSYVEIPGSFGIENNTLAPATGSFIAPWIRTGIPGTYEGEMKFDLTKWDNAFFDRLKDFVDPWTAEVIYSENLQSKGSAMKVAIPEINGFAGCRIKKQK